MTLEEFKRIFYYEWSHRMLGRAIGAAFILPGIFFAARGMLSKNIARRSLIIGSLIGFQGALGWYMVKSGLDEQLMEPGATPRVSQYRLAAHLGSAFLIYTGALMTGLKVLTDYKVSQGAYEVRCLVHFSFSQWIPPLQVSTNAIDCHTVWLSSPLLLPSITQS